MVGVWHTSAMEILLTDADRERLRYALGGREPDAWLARPTIALLPNALRLMPHARRAI
jgi:hypothetical protein